MENKTISILAVLGIVVLLSAGLVFAYRGDQSVKGPNYSEDRHQAIESALESGDYSAWKDLMTQDGRHPRIVDVVAEENFNTFVKMHEAMEDGNAELAQEYRTELGLGQGRMAHGEGHHCGMHQGRAQDMEDCQGCPMMK